MYVTWSHSAEDGDALARALEAHLNEFADEVISVSYAIDRAHHVLVVYRGIESVADAQVVAVAEQIVDSVQQ